MKNQYRKIVYVDEKGRTFEIQAKNGMILEAHEEDVGKLVIRTMDISKVNYANPPIPKGWSYVSGEWNNGLIIERDSDKSQFVWVPAEWLNLDGTLDGIMFNQKFGRRYYHLERKVFKLNFHEELEGKILLQAESIEKYGGFYISRYQISMRNGHTYSLAGKEPMTNISFYEAMRLANSFESTKLVKSHLTFGAEFDSILSWLVKSGAKTPNQISEDSSEWGNYADNSDTPKSISLTGSNKRWSANEIFDLAGNVEELTQEKYEDDYVVTRGGNYSLSGRFYPACYRNHRNPAEKNPFVGFRVALYIK